MIRASHLFVVVAALGACGGTTPTFLADMASSPDQTIQLFKIQSGDYTVTSLTNENDACKIDDGTIKGSKFTVTNDGQGNIMIKGFGSGMVSFNMGDIMTSGNTTAGTCSYMYSTKSHVTVTADNTLSVDYTEDDKGHSTSCMPVNVDCHSSWTMVLVKS